MNLYKTVFDNNDAALIGLPLIWMATKRKSRIIGIDPGTNFLGYAIIEIIGREIKLIEVDVLKINKGLDAQEKLSAIFQRISYLIDTHQPESLAIEAPFFGKNIQSMLKLGRAQGIAIAAGINKGLSITEYAPRKIKQSVTGNGNASKEQVKAMIEQTFFLKKPIDSYDASDALAVAMCHHYQTSNGLAGGSKANSWKKFMAENPGRVK